MQEVDPGAMSVPPYYPDHSVYREEIDCHYDCILEMDRSLGAIVELLREDGLYENTVVAFFLDHGMRLPKHKQFLYAGYGCR